MKKSEFKKDINLLDQFAMAALPEIQRHFMKNLDGMHGYGHDYEIKLTKAMAEDAYYVAEKMLKAREEMIDQLQREYDRSQ